MIGSYIHSSLGQHDAAVLAARNALQLISDSGIDLRALDGYADRLDRALMLAGRHAQAWPSSEKLARESAAGEGINSMAALRRSTWLTYLKRAGGQPLEALAWAEQDQMLMARIMSPGDSDALTLYEHGSALLELGRASEATACARSAVAHGLPTLGATHPLVVAAQQATL